MGTEKKPSLKRGKYESADGKKVFVTDVALNEATGEQMVLFYIDNGADGQTLDRPAMNALMEEIKSGAVSAVAVISVDRISRSFSTLAEWMRFCESHNVRCIAVESGEFN